MTSPERLASALESAEAAEAEAAATEAEAQAAVARVRAVRLRRRLEAASAHQSGDADTADRDSDGDAPAVEVTTVATARSRRLRRPSRKTLAAIAGIVLICVSLATSGYMYWQDRIALQHRQRAAEYATAAREGIGTLMSLDFNKTKDDLQRINDDSTGNFKNGFPEIAAQLTKGLEKSKVTTTVTVHDVAVESMTDSSAIVLVAATTEAKGPDGPPQQRSWHIALGLRRDGGKPKMANIEFVQ